MYGKIRIRADLEIKTGLHIGASNEFSAIGAVDSPVVRDLLTQQPIIPGSSLKGKLRTLLSRSLLNGKRVNFEDDPEQVKRLFGTALGSKDGSLRPYTSRLQFSDAFIKNAGDMEAVGLTEIKFENTIDRLSSKANPRQIERVARGSVFGVVIVYDAEDEKQIAEDFENVALAFKLLQMDYLGGHGTRGYGRVKFSNIEVDCVAGEISDEILKKAGEKLKEVEKDELLPV